MEYNEFGYLAGSPLSAAAWRQVCPNEPPGLVVTKHGAPPGILVFQNYIPDDLCKKLVAECDRITGMKSSVLNMTSATTMTVGLTENRICETIVVDPLPIDVTHMVRLAFTQVIAPHYRVEIDAFEKPDILRYREGGEYKPHADADTWIAPDRQWRRTVDRDISLLMYFNNDYEGGELVFPNFGSGLQPKAGMLIAFPSDHRYVHVAKPVKSGVRYAIVSWAQLKGSPRIQTTPRPGLIKP